MSCLFCSKKAIRGELLCGFCNETLEALRLDTHAEANRFWVGAERYPGLSLWGYRDLVRDCILDFKIQGRWLSGLALIKLAMQDQLLLENLQQIDAVMPAPSSLWGRLRGRFDLAATFAGKISHNYGIPYVETPRTWLGRWRKQALLSRSQREDNHRQTSGSRQAFDNTYFERKLSLTPDHRRLCILVLDDVVTTARTLTELADRFRNIDFRFLTLASAYRRA